MCYVCAMYSVTLEASSALHNAYTTVNAARELDACSKACIFSVSTDFVKRSLRIVDVL